MFGYSGLHAQDMSSAGFFSQHPASTYSGHGLFTDDHGQQWNVTLHLHGQHRYIAGGSVPQQCGGVERHAYKHHIQDLYGAGDRCQSLHRHDQLHRGSRLPGCHHYPCYHGNWNGWQCLLSNSERFRSHGTLYLDPAVRNPACRPVAWEQHWNHLWHTNSQQWCRHRTHVRCR